VTTSTTSTAWLDPAWQAEARGWIRAQLASLDIDVMGEITQPHVRPWSTVMRIPVSGSTVWFKANGGVTTYEPALLAALGELVPGSVLTPLAVDSGRGWSLSPDGGQLLRAAADRDLRHWERILPKYAELQRGLTPHADALIGLGVPDLRVEHMPQALARLLDEQASILDTPAGMTWEQHTALRALAPRFADWCTELAGAGVAPTLQHDDLHDANVLVGADHAYRFFDWGDAIVAQPFGTLLVTLRSIGHGFGLAPGSAELSRIRDVYLEPWTAEHDRASLVRASELAIEVAKVGRALGWQRALHGVADAGDFSDAVSGWLTELLVP
jgi:hypothetical protein